MNLDTFFVRNKIQNKLFLLLFVFLFKNNKPKSFYSTHLKGNHKLNESYICLHFIKVYAIHFSKLPQKFIMSLMCFIFRFFKKLNSFGNCTSMLNNELIIRRTQIKFYDYYLIMTFHAHAQVSHKITKKILYTRE